MWNNISSYCYDSASKGMIDESSDSIVYLPEAYMLSDTENKFIIVGCQTVAYIQVGDREGVRYASACTALCGPNGDDLASLMDAWRLLQHRLLRGHHHRGAQFLQYDV